MMSDDCYSVKKTWSFLSRFNTWGCKYLKGYGILKQPNMLDNFGLTGGDKPGDYYKFYALVGKSQNNMGNHHIVCNGRSFRI